MKTTNRALDTPHRSAPATRDRVFYVVHPLDDVPEDKVYRPETAGHRVMTPSVRWSLLALRVYLIVITALVILRVVQLGLAKH